MLSRPTRLHKGHLTIIQFRSTLIGTGVTCIVRTNISTNWNSLETRMQPVSSKIPAFTTLCFLRAHAALLGEQTSYRRSSGSSVLMHLRKIMHSWLHLGLGSLLYHLGQDLTGGISENKGNKRIRNHVLTQSIWQRSYCN